MTSPTTSSTPGPGLPPNPSQRHKQRILSLIVTIFALLLLTASIWHIRKVNENTVPTAIVGATENIIKVSPTDELPPVKTSTPMATSTPHVENPPLLVLCASNAVSQYNQSFPSTAYDSLSRYGTSDPNISHPDLNRIMKGLYTSGSIELLNCSDSDKILRTQSASQISSINTVRFNVPGGPRIKQYWVLMTARDTSTVEPSMQESIGAIYSECIDGAGTLSSQPARELRLGDDIADWTFRGVQAGGNEQYTIAYLRSTTKDVRRVFIGYDVRATQATDNSVQAINNPVSATRIRAAQMFAVPIGLNDECKGQLKSIRIEDTSSQVGLDILAVVLVPEGFSAPELSPRIIDEAPICLLNGNSSPDVDERSLFTDVQDIPGLESAKIGCGSSDYNIFPEIAENVHFSFTHILATYQGTSSPSRSNPKITINARNTIAATHLYLLLSARNMCVSPNTDSVVGKIKINDESPRLLRIGDNVRQGRTNFVPSNDGCTSGAKALYMNPVDQQQDAEYIEGYPGIPLRAKVNDRVPVDAELWLDLIKIRLPEGITNIKIEIENTTAQTDVSEKPFITLYAATLVREGP